MSAPDLEPTGERLLPDHYRGQLVHAEHLARYQLAAQLAPGRRVLDVACGEGYGSAMLLAAGAQTVSAVDVHALTVEHARARYGIEAVVGDIGALGFDDDAFDLVVSFETIEHVSEPERALDELARVRAPGGLLVISTPIAGQYQVENEFHHREFTHDEFIALLRARFPAVRLLFQHNWLVSAVLDEESMGRDDGAAELEAGLTKVRGVPAGKELYLVAICGQDVDVGLRQVGVMAGTDESHDLAHRLTDAIETQERLAVEARDAHRRFEEIQATAQWMRSTWSWSLTRPFRLGQKLRRRR